MNAIDIPAIERHARTLRAQEMQRIQGLVGERLRLYALLLAGSLLALLETLGEVIRPLFSWNPQSTERTTTAKAGPSLIERINRGARGLFSWNPQQRHS